MNVKDFREKYSFTQEGLGRLVGVSKATIYNMEKGLYLDSKTGKKVISFIRAYDRRKTLINEYSKKFHKKGSLLDFFASIWRKAQ